MGQAGTVSETEWSGLCGSRMRELSLSGDLIGCRLSGSVSLSVILAPWRGSETWSVSLAWRLESEGWVCVRGLRLSSESVEWSLLR